MYICIYVFMYIHIYVFVYLKSLSDTRIFYTLLYIDVNKNRNENGFSLYFELSTEASSVGSVFLGDER